MWSKAFSARVPCPRRCGNIRHGAGVCARRYGRGRAGRREAGGSVGAVVRAVSGGLSLLPQPQATYSGLCPADRGAKV